MPKDTFFNLNIEKQAKIVENIYQTYSDNEFYDVTIAKVVVACQIPRGSFYQYFENLEDVVTYLFSVLNEKIFQDKLKILENSDDFWSYLNEVLLLELNAFDDQKYSNFIKKTFRYINPYLKYQMFDQNMEKLMYLLIEKNFDRLINNDKEMLEQLLVTSNAYKYGYIFANLHLKRLSREEAINKYKHFLKILQYGSGKIEC